MTTKMRIVMTTIMKMIMIMGIWSIITIISAIIIILITRWFFIITIIIFSIIIIGFMMGAKGVEQLPLIASIGLSHHALQQKAFVGRGWVVMMVKRG